MRCGEHFGDGRVCNKLAGHPPEDGHGGPRVRGPKKKSEPQPQAEYRCYCCGDALGPVFALVSYTADVDRVFLMKPEHAVFAEAKIITLVQVAKIP